MQVVVVVTAGLKAHCFDHNLAHMWERDVSGSNLLLQRQRHLSVHEVCAPSACLLAYSCACWID
jgi:hypothetical protein